MLRLSCPRNCCRTSRIRSRVRRRRAIGQARTQRERGLGTSAASASRCRKQSNPGVREGLTATEEYEVDSALEHATLDRLAQPGLILRRSRLKGPEASSKQATECTPKCSLATLCAAIGPR